MELTKDIVALGNESTSIAKKRSAQVVMDKIIAVKQKGNSDEIISNLEEIINELISDKNRLIQISQAYEEILITQKISKDEIDYLSNSVIPLLEEFLAQSDQENGEKIQSGIDTIKPILSKEFFNILQILGFNFKKAVGEPLTEWVASLIRANINTNDRNMELQILSQQREIEYFKICQDEEAYKRLMNEVGNK